MNKSKAILLVEDNEDDQSLFIEAIKGIEKATLYDVAHNGKEALEKLENSEILPDLIFMDINMPVMDGIECLSEIIKNPKTTNIPVIILSTANEQIETVRKQGAKAFVEKPWNQKALRANVEEMINLNFIGEHQISNQNFKAVLSIV